MTTPLMQTARNIVNQLGDVWDVDVENRQTANDRLDRGVEAILREIAAEAWEEGNHAHPYFSVNPYRVGVMPRKAVK